MHEARWRGELALAVLVVFTNFVAAHWSPSGQTHFADFDKVRSVIAVNCR
jgi:hypothetical protein